MAITDAPIRDSLVDGKWSKIWAGFFQQLVASFRTMETDIVALQAAVDTYTVRRVTFAMSPYSPVAADDALIVEASGGNVLINLPNVTATGRRLRVKKIDGTANTVTLDGFGAQTIDGALTKVISTQYASLDILEDSIGGVWWLT